jgi:hypothetical protein
MAKKLKFGSPAWRRKYNLAGSRKKRTRGTMAKKKKSYSKSSGMPRWAKVLIGGAIPAAYGAFRKPIADALPNIPKVENYSDEIILGGGALAVSLFTGNKYVNMVTKPIADVELARVGEKIKLGIPMGNPALTGSVSQTQNLAGYI